MVPGTAAAPGYTNTQFRNYYYIACGKASPYCLAGGSCARLRTEDGVFWGGICTRTECHLPQPSLTCLILHSPLLYPSFESSGRNATPLRRLRAELPKHHRCVSYERGLPGGCNGLRGWCHGNYKPHHHLPAHEIGESISIQRHTHTHSFDDHHCGQMRSRLSHSFLWIAAPHCSQTDTGLTWTAVPTLPTSAMMFFNIATNLDGSIWCVTDAVVRGGMGALARLISRLGLVPYRSLQ